jgi:GH15 family glucan-1,4-alpha-glucosidase
MPRDLIFGNGQFLVNLDKYLNIRDIYFPYVGQLNHVAGHHCRVRVWAADVGFSWLGEDWQRDLAYIPDTMVSECTAKNNRLGLTLHIQHGVSPNQDIFFERISVVNHWRADRSIRLFFAFDLRIDESDIGDTAFYHPFTGSMIHYKRDRFILASGIVGDGAADQCTVELRGVSRYACGIKEFGGAEGTWRDAEDGLLSGNAIAQGSVDSVIGFDIDLPSEGRERLDVWIAVGSDLDTVTSMHDRVVAQGIDPLVERSKASSRSSPAAEPDGLSDLPDRVSSLFKRSVLLMLTQIDRRGAFLHLPTPTSCGRLARTIHISGRGTVRWWQRHSIGWVCEMFPNRSSGSAWMRWRSAR